MTRKDSNPRRVEGFALIAPNDEGLLRIDVESQLAVVLFKGEESGSTYQGIVWPFVVKLLVGGEAADVVLFGASAVGRVLLRLDVGIVHDALLAADHSRLAPGDSDDGAEVDLCICGGDGWYGGIERTHLGLGWRVVDGEGNEVVERGFSSDEYDSML